MGIKNLANVIKGNAPKTIKQNQLKYYSGHKIAIDASMCIYQFLVSVRSEGNNLAFGDSTTSHLNGLFYRCIRWIEAGIIPIFVFDGAAPAAKIHELSKRQKRREDAQEKLDEAVEKGDLVAKEKYEKMNVRMTKEHISDCMKLLEVLKIPFITAPSEAEAYCAYLNKNNYVDAVATEDMDTLCFGAPTLLRNFNASKSKNLAIDEYDLQEILKGMGMELDEFVNMCILLGCDYSKTLKGIGPKKAVDFIKRGKTIEEIIEENRIEPDEEFRFDTAKDIFMNLSGDEFNKTYVCEEKIETDENGKNVFLSKTNIENISKITFDVKTIEIDEVVKYMVNEKGFDQQRIENGVKKLRGCKVEGKQTRIESFVMKK